MIIFKKDISYEVKIDNKKERINPLTRIYPPLYINQPFSILVMLLLTELQEPCVFVLVF